MCGLDMPYLSSGNILNWTESIFWNSKAAVVSDSKKGCEPYFSVYI